MTRRRNTYLLWVAHNLERIAGRVTYIAERVAFVVNGDVKSFRLCCRRGHRSLKDGGMPRSRR